VTGAARAAGVTRKTVHKWLSEDVDFIALHGSLLADMHDSVRQGLLLLAPKALRTISGLLSRRGTPPAIKLKASIALLELVAAAPPEGPSEEIDARIEIANRKRSRKLKATMARLDVTDEDLDAHLARPIDEAELSEVAEIEDDLDDDSEEDLDDDLDEREPLASRLTRALQGAIQDRIDRDSAGAVTEDLEGLAIEDGPLPLAGAVVLREAIREELARRAAQKVEQEEVGA
jgi:hypothetical protein